MRYYSRRNVFEVLLMKAFRDAGLDFPRLRYVARLVSAFLEEFDSILKGTMTNKMPTVLHLIDGKLGYLSTADGKATSMVFEIGPDGGPIQSGIGAPAAEQRAISHTTVDLGKLQAQLEGE